MRSLRSQPKKLYPLAPGHFTNRVDQREDFRGAQFLTGFAACQPRVRWDSDHVITLDDELQRPWTRSLERL
jgi:L-rhamnose isomerase